MPKILRVRAAHGEREEKQVRTLAGSRHGPADWILHARMVARSWDGQRVEAIARELHCNPQTVRRRLHRFDCIGYFRHPFEKLTDWSFTILLFFVCHLILNHGRSREIFLLHERKGLPREKSALTCSIHHGSHAKAAI